MSLKLKSPAFETGGPIPPEYTSDGENVSPPLNWSDPPRGTRSFALIVDDPDARDPAKPERTWVHWVLYNLPPAQTRLPRHTTAQSLPRGAHEGINDWQKPGWRGPSPPRGRHRYFHKIYALDVELPELGHADKATVERAMEGHVLATAELVGTYEHRGV